MKLANLEDVVESLDSLICCIESLNEDDEIAFFEQMDGSTYYNELLYMLKDLKESI